MKQQQNNLLCLFSITLSAVLFAGCNAPSNNQAGFSLPVTLMKVDKEASLDTSEFMAEVNNDASVTVHANATGVLKQVLVHDGQSVHKGQALFTLEAGQQAAQVKSLEAQASSALQEPQIADENLKALQAERQTVLSDLKFNTNQLNRFQGLLATQSVSKKDVEQYETTVSNLTSKLANIDASVTAQLSRKNQARNSAQRDKYTYQSAKANLAYYTVVAPFSGIIGEVTGKPGNYVSSSTELASITNNKSVEIETAVSSDYQRQLKHGGKLEVLDASGNLLSTATVTFISPKVDKASQTILVKANINNNKALFLADQKLKLRFIWKTDHSILVPVEAVFRMAGQPFVYIAAQNTEKGKTGLVAKMKAVELGPIRGNNYVINSGLTDGEVIVTGSIQKLQNNTPIQDAALMQKQPASPAL